jgi:hypothetical protein
MNRLYPAETRLKEGATALDSGTEQVGMFPCRGWVAPCQRTGGSIKEGLSDVKRREVQHAPLVPMGLDVESER